MSTEGSPSKRSSVRPLNPAALSFESKASPPPEPVGGLDSNASPWDQSHAVAGSQGFTVTSSEPRRPSGYGTSGSSTPPQPISPPKGPVIPGIGYPPGIGLPGPTALTEVEFLHTRQLIGHVQRPALVAVLQSLLDDFPQLAPVIRVRCEKAMNYLMSQHQSHAFSTPATSGGQWASDTMTPPGSTKKGSSGGKRRDEETEICGLHGTARATKHLAFNPLTQHFECIPGFHCLVDHRERSSHGTPLASGHATPIPASSPQKRASTILLGGTEPRAPEDAGRTSPGLDVNRLESLLERLRAEEAPS